MDLVVMVVVVEKVVIPKPANSFCHSDGFKTHRHK